VKRKRSQRSALLKARDFIRQHCSRSVTLDELSALTGLSRYHLVRAFAKEFGLPPHAYQIRLQIEKAKAMLDAGVLPAVVAAETGFADQSHFTRHFKKINGTTPRKYAGPRKREPR
jgi:AraC-like DNA-binding protein